MSLFVRISCCACWQRSVPLLSLCLDGAGSTQGWCLNVWCVRCRFTKTAGLIVNRMGANVNHMATSVKKAWEKAKDEASGGGKRDN